MNAIYDRRNPWEYQYLTHQNQQVNMACNLTKPSPWSGVTISQGSLDINVEYIQRFEESVRNKSLLEGLRNAGIKAPIAIQNTLLPTLYSDGGDGLLTHCENIIVHAPEQSGKTTAALIRALDVVLSPKDTRSKVVFIYPTRDLACQMIAKAKQLAKFCCQLDFHLAVRDSESTLSARRVVRERFIVGTPDKIREHVMGKSIPLQDLRLIVLDGIDSASTGGAGHLNTVTEMYKKIPKDTVATILLSSHTKDVNMDKFVKSIVFCPMFVQFPHKIQRRLSKVKHHYLSAASFFDKLAVVLELLKRKTRTQVIVLCDSREGLKDIYGELKSKRPDVSVSCLHGKVQPVERDAILESFRKGKHKVLVMTPTNLQTVEFKVERNATLVNYDTQTCQPSKDCLDHSGYQERARILDKIPGGLSVNIIHDKWNGFATDEYERDMKLGSVREFGPWLRELDKTN